MSAITGIHTAILGALATSLSGHKKMFNPYIPEMNDDLCLRKAYGMFMGPAENTNRAIDCYYSVRRSCFITLSLQNKGTEKDSAIRETAERELMEYMVTLAKAMEREPTLGGLVSYFRYASDSGIEFVAKEHDNFLMIRTEFSFEYLEGA
jgi:hypothetical protein